MNYKIEIHFHLIHPVSNIKRILDGLLEILKATGVTITYANITEIKND